MQAEGRHLRLNEPEAAIRSGIPPSELVVANALHQSLPEFLWISAQNNFLAKFVVERQDADNMEMFRLAS